MASYLDILRPQVLTQVVRQVVGDADPILGFLGMEPGGANERSFGHGREGSYHVFDDSRKTAQGRAPGTPAGRSAKQPFKQVPFVYPRMHDSSQLLAEFYHNLGRIDDPAQRDAAGKDQIMRQTNILAQKAANWRVAMCVGMLRDQCYIHQDGDTWYPTYTSSSALLQVSQNVPAGNKDQLNMTDRASSSIFSANILDVPWSSAGANIPLHFAKINQARAAQGIGPVTDCLCNSITWNWLISNDYLAAMAGIANPPFEAYQREARKRPDGSPVHEYIGRFNALPGVEFHVSDVGLELYDPSTYTTAFAKHFADGMVIMTANPKSRSDLFTGYQGSEPIAEYDGGPETVRTGLSSWSVKRANPTCTEMYVLDNFMPVCHDPYNLIVADVDF